MNSTFVAEMKDYESLSSWSYLIDITLR